jgi:hypothetical protein
MRYFISHFLVDDLYVSSIVVLVEYRGPLHDSNTF